MTVVERDAPASPARRPAPVRRRTRLRLLLVGVVLAGALVFLLVEGLGNALNYFDTVHQALAHKSSLGTTTFRLEGVVVKGSIRPTALGTDFVVAEGAERVPVDNTGSPPGLFQADIPVVVVGHFSTVSSDTFVSNQIMVKHSADYIAAHPNRVRAPNGTVR
jgi:cytochrome c-type biogenesis protein CcmE